MKQDVPYQLSQSKTKRILGELYDPIISEEERDIMIEYLEPEYQR